MKVSSESKPTIGEPHIVPVNNKMLRKLTAIQTIRNIPYADAVCAMA